uniref:Uncharacterized protein n=1 Tax=Ralstonia solanacearum CFBP2957 TaxID=859656 RepID=D8P674_RALSL|nr:protein of unknown function [Ralstonia solanacearum CFBP2957]
MGRHPAHISLGSHWIGLINTMRAAQGLRSTLSSWGCVAAVVNGVIGASGGRVGVAGCGAAV